MNRPRPATVVVVVGTGTEVGKTWVSARLLGAWRAAGRTVAARKPAQSFEPGEGPTDAEVLGAAAGEPPEAVCPPGRWYPRALAPPMAAEALGLDPPRLADLRAELSWPDPAPDVGLVETAGGVRSPHAADADGVALVDALAPDAVVLVADAGLGTINAVRLTAAALGLRPGGEPALAVVLNRFEPARDLHRRNRAWLAGRDGFRVVTDGELGALAAAL